MAKMNYGETTMQDKVMDAYNAWMAADEAWSAALARCYGSHAGDARYDERGRAGVLEPLYREFHVARKQYMALRGYEVKLMLGLI